ESWSVEPDGKSYRFKLRKGVQFHNGFGEFTGRDVQAWYQGVLSGPPTAGAGPLAGEMRTTVDSVEVVNDYEVVFHNRVPSYLFLYFMGAGTNATGMFSKADFDARGGKLPATLADPPLAGTGPWQFVERVQGQYVRFARVPYQHWRLGQADIPELEIRWIPENASRLNALLAGEVHAAA